MDRVALAEAFLQEAVYRSRGKQAALSGLAGLAPDAELAAGQCGLGKRAAEVLDLSPAGAELAGRLWSAPPDEAALAGAREVMRGWIREQDALDRDRNHFLKGFRRANGFDRGAWSAEQLAAYEAGLDEINRRCDRSRREHAERLLAHVA